MDGEKLEIVQGTLDWMVLENFASMGSSHGYGIARRIEQISDEPLRINQGTIYGSPFRLMQRGWNSSGARRTATDPSRKPDVSSALTEARNWERVSTVIGRVLRIAERG